MRLSFFGARHLVDLLRLQVKFSLPVLSDVSLKKLKFFLKDLELCRVSPRPFVWLSRPWDSL